MRRFFKVSHMMSADAASASASCAARMTAVLRRMDAAALAGSILFILRGWGRIILPCPANP